MRLVNYPAEMFNDALYFLEEAKKLGSSSKNDWLRWRYLRATILYSFGCLKAYVNSLITDYIQHILKLPEGAKKFKKNEDKS
jgi:hypothetical protein